MATSHWPPSKTATFAFDTKRRSDPGTSGGRTVTPVPSTTSATLVSTQTLRLTMPLFRLVTVGSTVRGSDAVLTGRGQLRRDAEQVLAGPGRGDHGDL